LVLYSYAKLNLYLEVIRKRHDGYHDIRTIFERINLCDKIILKSLPDKKIKLSSNLPSLPVGSSNLAYRSAKLLQETFDINKGVEIKIIKRIPVGAGLGGGSSNAACVLMGLNKLWRLNLNQNKLAQLAKKIGSDVPFFIYDCQFAGGLSRGDRIEPLRASPRLRLWHILVVPKFKVSTPVIYKKWDKMAKTFKLTRQGEGVKIFTLALRKNNPSLLGEALFNSLEQVTTKLYPQVLRIKEKLSQIGLKSILMSGSGPAVFGIVSSRKEALTFCRQLKANRLIEVFVTRTR